MVNLTLIIFFYLTFEFVQVLALAIKKAKKQNQELTVGGNQLGQTSLCIHEQDGSSSLA